MKKVFSSTKEKQKYSSAHERPRVNFATSAPTVPSVYITDEVSIAPPISSHPVIDDLCLALHPSHNSSSPKCLGILASGQRKHLIYRGDLRFKRMLPVKDVPKSLERVLRSPPSGTSQEDRLKLAVQLASTVMQLHDTAWLKERWRGADILFHSEGSYTNSILRRPIIVRSFDEHPDDGPDEDGLEFLTADKTLYSLGIILLELHYGKPLAEIGMDPELSGEGELDTAAKMHLHIMRCFKQLEGNSGLRYRNAVRSCLKGFELDEREVGLQKDKYKNMVEAKIVSQLEEELRDFTGVEDLSTIL
jgi:hypothetical protein